MGGWFTCICSSIVMHTHYTYTVQYKILTFFDKIEHPDRKRVQNGILRHIIKYVLFFSVVSSAFGFEVSNKG